MKFVFVGVSDGEKDGKLITFSRKRSRGKLAITMLKYIRPEWPTLHTFLSQTLIRNPARNKRVVLTRVMKNRNLNHSLVSALNFFVVMY